MQQYDAIIIGSGQAGNPLAHALAEAGQKVAVVERKHVGGTCVNEGCTPTKTMAASARVAYLARRAAEYGVNIGAVDVDLAVVRKRKNDVVARFRNGNQQSLEDVENIDLIFGEAAFTGPKTLTVRPASAAGDASIGAPRELTAESIFINTGGRPVQPPIDGLDAVPTLDSTTIMDLERVPDHLLIIGGGYIGVEFGQMFRRFGSRVTMIQRGAQLLNREDADVAEAVADILREDGIDLLLNSAAAAVEQAPDGTIQLTVQTQGEQGTDQRTLTGSHLLLAAGRAPNTDALDPAAAGIETDKRGYIPVNERLETNVPGIYALGDVKGGPAFTHIAYDDFRIVRANLLNSDGPRTTADRPVPYTVFMDPQLARVGLSESQAKEEGYNVAIAKIPMANVARAIEIDETRGFMKAVVDVDTEQILGCAILAVEGGEIMAVLQMAMMGRVPYTAIRDGVFSHPTFAESLNNLFSSL